ncbi:MAG: adenylosuccinate lyase [Deltaproteobacteria bacterium]|nr:adenylosuccinate lyase [Deltaproteobacteria bacterium]
MVERYTRKEMARIWEAENRFRIWLEIETLACERQAELGVIPREAVAVIREKGNFDIQRINAVEAEVKHDVIAFLTSVAEFVGPEARFIHQGMTSSDILDTCFSVQLVQSADELLADIRALLETIKKRALEHQYTVCIGRSHGIHAEPITFGLKLASWYAEMDRNLVRLQRGREAIATGAISGAVGTFANIDPSVEAYVCAKLGLKPEPVSTQVIPRDRHAEYFCTLAVIASSMERIAVEIRHLQRTEVIEAEEHFSIGQKGSSAMPHKRNPVLSENLTGLARLVRAYALPALENVPLWHERDISHSSVERAIGPDATVTLDFALRRLNGLIRDLVVYPDRMRRNMDLTHGLLYSQRVLLELTQAGVSREEAYRMVQRNAMRAWEEEKDFLQELLRDAAVVSALGAEKLRSLFDPDYHLVHVDNIFARVFGAEG